MNHPCRFGDGEAIGRWRLSRGCVAYPDDREQDMCEHHARRATPLGTFEMTDDYTQGQKASEVFR